MRSTDPRRTRPSFLAQTALALAPILALSSCGGGGPAVPEIDSSALEPALRERLADRQRAVEAQPESAEAWGALGLACDVHGLFAPAASSYARAAELDPADARWPYFHGLTVSATEPLVAAGLFERALALDPDRVALHVLLGRARLAGEELEAARSAFEAALALAPDTPAARIGLASIALARGETDVALEELARARAAGTKTSEVDRLEAQARRALGELELAVELERLAGAAVAREPVDDPLRAEAEAAAGVTLRWRRARALAALGEGRPADALDELERAVSADPTSSRPLSALGDVCLRAGDAERALDAYDRALVLAPDEGELELGRANAFSMLGRFDEALASCARALELDPGLHIARVNQGALLVQAGQVDEGLALLKAGCEALPDDADVWFNYGQALMRAERFDEAAGAYARARRIDPRHRARFELAGVLMRARQFEQAAAELEALSVLDPDRVVVHANLVLVWRKAEQDEEALVACRRGLETFPDDPALLRELALLLAASPVDSLRDVEEARKVMGRYAVLPRLSPPLAMQVDAIVRAEEGEYERAVELADLALAQLKTARLAPGFKAVLEGELRAQRELYASGEPYRRAPADR